MRPGIFFVVVGPSGSGKDTLIDGARAALGADGRFRFARRVITREAGAAGEDHEAVAAAEFARREAAGEFLLSWSAHGLSYGLGRDLLALVGEGRHVVANGSRAALPDLVGRVPRLVVLEVWAPPEVLAERIAGRGRETQADIRTRVARDAPALPAGVAVVQVANDATPELGIQRFVAALAEATSRLAVRRMPIDTDRRNLAFLPGDSSVVRASDYLGSGRVDVRDGAASVRAEVAVVEPGSLLRPDEIGLSTGAFARLGRPDGTEVSLVRTPSPESRDALRAKIRGAVLDEAGYDLVVRDIVEDRYPEGEVAGFLVAANNALSDDEVVALARVRARSMPRVTWDEPIVVDKHSMGGIPGSRITLIVVPIVAAHGLAMPKTSSRAITSAAGTADAMETVARVDLTADDLRRVIGTARGCIAWNGRLNHSALDDVMNAITRPLGLDSARWSVASILSKKLSAGSTHVVVDLPWAPRARIGSEQEADALGRLFEAVGAGLGLTVEAVPTDGRHPIGRGIGPALEVRDVLWVLENHPDAPADLRAKALAFASRIIAWDPSVRDLAEARRRAETLLDSGAARIAFDRIVDAQGRREQPVLPGMLTRTVRSPRSGLVTSIDGFTIAGVARRAGAPSDKGAGLDLLARAGDHVMVGDALYVVHSSTPADLEAACAAASASPGFSLDDLPIGRP